MIPSHYITLKSGREIRRGPPPSLSSFALLSPLFYSLLYSCVFFGNHSIHIEDNLGGNEMEELIKAKNEVTALLQQATSHFLDKKVTSSSFCPSSSSSPPPLPLFKFSFITFFPFKLPS